MKRLVIIFLVFILLFSTLNLVASKPISSINSEADLENSYDQTIFDDMKANQVLTNFNKLNGYFTENSGQVDNESVRYYIQGKGVWFRDDGVMFEIKEFRGRETINTFDRFHPEFEPEMPQPRKSVVLKLNFEGADKVIPKGGGVLSHKSNFFIGNDSSKWHTNVPNYQEILYENLYDNIDLRYYSSPNGLKYDFIVHPGGNPNDIKMSYEGAEQLNIDLSGNLKVETLIGDILDSDLFIYQDSNNENNKIEGVFNKIDSMTYGFEILSKYNLNRDLIIDPLIYSTYIGGVESDGIGNIAIDANGNAYVTGNVAYQGFPTTPGAYDTTINDIYGDAVVFKLNSSGSQLIYSTFIGGTMADGGGDIAVDTGGNAYVMGGTGSDDFPTTFGAYDTSYNFNGDIVILKLNSDGSSLLYSSYFGGNFDDGGAAIEIDSSTNVYIGGSTTSQDFPTTPGAYATGPTSWEEAFALKLNPAGNGQNDLIYSTYIGSSNIDHCCGFTIDPSGNAYLTGTTRLSNDFPTTPGAYDTTHNGDTNTDEDIFVLKLNPTMSSVLYSTFIGGIDEEAGFGIAVDASGNIIITGYATSTDFPTTQGAFDTTYNGGTADAIVLKLNPSGNGLSDLVYSTFVGGSNIEWGSWIAIDSSGNAYVTFGTASSNFPTTINAYDNTYNGGSDGYLFKLNSNGSSLLYSTFIGGSAAESFDGLAIDSNNNVYLTGSTNSSDFPTTPGAYDTTFNGGWKDGVVLKLWINSTTPPNVLNLQISKPSILRTNPIFLYSNATDPGDAEEDLTPIFEYRDSNEQIWNNTYFSNLHYNNSRWEVCFISPKNATTGQYDFRVRYYDSEMSFSNWYYLNNSLLVLNNFPEIIDLSLSINSSIQNQNLSIYINTTDIEDEEQNLTIELRYKDPAYQNWNTTYLGTAEYNVDRWEMDFCAPFGSLFGFYNFKVRAIDEDGNNSNWFFKNDSLLIYNLNPEVLNIEISQNVIYRTESISLLVNGSDYETSEQLLELTIQYKLHNEENWENLQGNYLNEHWRATYTTKINTTLGYYDFRAKFKDLNNGISEWLYLNNSLFVLNNLPIVENIELSKNTAILGDKILIQINGNDVEELEEILTIILENRGPTEQSWDTVYLDSPKYLNEQWGYSFSIPFDAPFGYYDFRTKFIDSDGNYSAWLYANDSLLVYNMNPKVIDVKITESVVYRTNSIFLSINGTDHETPENMLIFYAQFKHDSESVWTGITGEYSNSNNNWKVEFVTGKESILGYYDFRVKFEDNESASSGWVYFNDSFEILNNPPIIAEDLDEIYVDAAPLHIDLTQYESDIEDNDEGLIWSVDETKSYDFIKSVKLIDNENDILEIVPKEDVVGQDDIELTLTDKDNDIDIRSDITIYVDSIIIVMTEETPKVTLISPSDGSILNILTPKLEWDIEYSGEEIVTYSIFLDENPTPYTLMTSDISTTSFTIEDELKPGKTYYWKVIPKDGLCISDPFSFTIRSVFKPFYQVNLTTETNYIVLKQGGSSEIELTVENEGNAIDDYKLEYSSNKLQTQINIDKTSFKLAPGIISIQKLSITIPENFELGKYSIFITAISQNDMTVTDEDFINVEVVSQDFIPDHKVRISVSPESIDIYQNESDEITLTILNEGNIIDEYLIYFESDDFTIADIQLNRDFLSLKADEDYEVRVKIIIPETKEIGEYEIKFIAKSDFTSDNATFKLNVKAKETQELLNEDTKTSSSSLDNVYLLLFLIILGLLVISCISIGGTEIGKYKFLSIFFVPLYNKLHPDDILDNFTRGQIYGYIKAKPGENYNAIKNALEIHNSTFSYHLRILEKEKYIYSQRDGFYTRFYPKGVKAPIKNGLQFNEFQKEIIDKIRANPGITQHEIVSMSGISQQAVSYNLNKLARDNILKIDKVGRENKYCLNYDEQTIPKIQVKNRTQPIPVQQ